MEAITYKTINEICEEYRVTRFTVVNWIKAGKLKAIRLNTQYRIAVADWNSFVESSSSH
jgi:excisionase family DNA binding protein